MGIEKRRSTRTKINSYDTYKGIGDCDYYERTRISKQEKNEQILNEFIPSKNKKEDFLSSKSDLEISVSSLHQTILELKSDVVSLKKSIELFFRNFSISSKNKTLNPFFKDNPVPLSCHNCRHNKWSAYRMKHYCENIGKNSHNLFNENQCNYGWITKEREHICVCDNHELKYSCKNCLHKEFNEQINNYYCKIGNYSNGLISGEKYIRLNFKCDKHECDWWKK